MNLQIHALADLLAPPGTIHAVATHLWQSSLFTLAVWLATLALRRNRAAVRHGLWLAASVKFLVPLSLLMGLGSHIEWRKAPAPTRDHAPSVMEEISQPFALLAPAPLLAPVPRAPSRIPAVLFGVWLCGFAANNLAWWRRWRRVRAALRAASLPPPESLTTEPVRAMYTPARLEPGVFGIFRPVLLLPEGITERLTPAQFRAILAHEVCHIRRRDNLAAAIHMAVEGLFWFHPLVWWMQNRMVEERERACDEEVLRMANDPQDYAEGIVSVCKLYLESPLVCFSGVTGSNLKRRVEAIMINRDTNKLNFGKKAALAAAGIVAVTVPLAVGQSQTPGVEKRREFEVASIRRANDDGDHDSNRDNAIFRTHNLSLKRLISQAYGIDLRQIYGGPNWVDSDSYDINARIAGDAARLTGNEVSQMIQSLLADRFKLVIHRETRQISGYELVVAKKGARMERAKPDGHSDLHSNNTHLKAENVTMENFAKSLSRNRDVGELVVDKTGLTGGFNFELDWMPERPDPRADASGDDRSSIFTAVQEQLGLKLESAKVPVPAIVIDRAEKPELD
jgi:bla regulator protein blaR1